MEHFAFIFTIFFMLLGPIKIIPTFAALTRDRDTAFKRALALRAAVIAATLVVFVALAGGSLLDRYHISLNALRMGGSLVLVLSALNTIFGKPLPVEADPKTPIWQLAAAPVAIPAIVPPAGVAAILIFVMLTPGNPGMGQAIALALIVILLLDFLVMAYIDQVLKTPGLLLAMQVIGAALVFIQVCIGIELFLRALKDLGFITGPLSAGFLARELGWPA